MKKLFTLVALLAMVLGANAQAGKWEKVYSIDYTTLQGFPFYVMGYVPEFTSGCMTDFGANYKYAEVKEGAEETSDVIVKTQAGVEYYRWTEGGGWHQYFIADGISTKIDGKYKVIAKVKASAACSINVNMGWGWGDGESKGTSVAIPGDSEFQEVTWEYSGIGGSSCNLVAQPGTCTETIEWESLEVYEWQKEGQRPKEWLEDIENGDAEKSWEELGLDKVKFDDEDNNFKVCAWSKERGVNMNEKDGWDPFPATIEDVDGSKVFVCHGKAATSEGDAAAWDNQFWIQSKHAWKAGTTVKIKFRYKASKEVEVETQTHKQKPSDYLIWHGIGNVTFKEDWQDFSKEVTFAEDMVGGWSFAFNLNAKDKEAIDFYFDNISWQYLKLDEGFFVAGINATTTPSYDDLDNAIEFTNGDSGYLEAVVGVSGDAKSYVDQVMISTTRGDDQAFKGATLKPERKIKNDVNDWQEYTAATNAKLDLPGLGVWKIYIDTEYSAMTFEMLEGTEYIKEVVPVYTYTDELVVNGAEREDLKDSWDANKQELTVREEADNNTAEDSHGAGGEGHNGETWDNQFFIKADRALAKGEVTKLVFKYKASVDPAKATTQCHGQNPGDYKHWAAIGDIAFEGADWAEFDQEFKVPDEADGMWNIAFNLAEIKEACVYTFKDVQWYVVDAELEEGQTYENLISGAANFFIKEGAGSTPVAAGITEVVNKNVKSSNVMYNLAGQRVSNGFKGIVIKDGKKYVK